jgi:hypothetical protein
MPGLVPGIHVFASLYKKHVDGRDNPGHDKKRNRFQVTAQKGWTEFSFIL